MRYSVKNMGDGWFGVVDKTSAKVVEYRASRAEAEEVADRMNAVARCAGQKEEKE